MIRINKYICESGICSRRAADVYVKQGVVFIDGKQAMIGDKVLPGDKVTVNGLIIEPLTADKVIFIALNKPVGIVCTAEKTEKTRIVGLDLSEGMLNIARKKVDGNPVLSKIEFIKGDSEALPFADNSFEAITVSFGIRNFENLERGLSEIWRVLTPNGIFVILETSVPVKFPFKQGYHFYSKKILPIIGRVFSRDKVAYTYLSESASVFPFGDLLNNILRKIGFIDVKNNPQTFGVATIYCATK